MDLPQLGPAALHLAESAARNLQLVHVRCIGVLDGVWTLHFDLLVERQSAGSERLVGSFHLCGQLAVLKLVVVSVAEVSRSCVDRSMSLMVSGALLILDNVFNTRSCHWVYIPKVHGRGDNGCFFGEFQKTDFHTLPIFVMVIHLVLLFVSNAATTVESPFHRTVVAHVGIGELFD